MKKTYISPAVAVVVLQAENMIATSIVEKTEEISSYSGGELQSSEREQGSFNSDNYWESGF